MSELSKSARAAAKAKIERLMTDPKERVDASDYTPPDALETGVQTGPRPVSKRQYKKGGKVLGKAEGKEAHKHAGKKPRKDGGKTMPPVDAWLNRDEKIANEYRDGEKHIGGMKRGGSAHPDEAEDRNLVRKMVKEKALTGKAKGGRTERCDGGMAPEISGTRPTGGRTARKNGGRTKGKTNINIVIASPHRDAQGVPGQPMPGMPPHAPLPMPTPGPSTMTPPGAMPQAGMTPAGGPLPPGAQPRKHGGRTKGGGGGGLGRLEKIEEYGGR